MREQKGHIFHKGKSWFVRYSDNVLRPDGTSRRKLMCAKLPVEHGGDYRTKASVKPFVAELLAPINRGALDVRSTMRIPQFVEQVYFPQFVDPHLRASTRKGYRDIWQDHLKPRVGDRTLRDFRTKHGEDLLYDIARQDKLGRHSLQHVKSFLSGVFKQAKRLGILDGVNPMQDTSIPRTPEPPDTHAYSLEEIRRMLLVLDEPAKTVVAVAAFTGMRKGEIAGLQWSDYDDGRREIHVSRALWRGIENDPKTARSRAPIPVLRQLAAALSSYKLCMGRLAVGPIFQAGNGKPLNLDNLARRVIAPALRGAGVTWHGWHAFRRGLATTLHAFGVDDKTIQAILRHSNVALTMSVYVKSVAESQISAMDMLSANLEKGTSFNDLSTIPKAAVN